VIYAVAGILELAGEKLRESGQMVALVYIMKPLLMPILIGWMLANRELLKEKIHENNSDQPDIFHGWRCFFNVQK
jgi:hypothetical protein